MPKGMQGFQKGNQLWQRRNYVPPMLGKHHSETTKKKIGVAMMGSKGHKHSEDTRRKISESHRGKKSYRWKGGITNEKRLIRKGIEYKLWRERVFIRDNFTCQECKKRSGKGLRIYLEADHILSFSEYPKLRFLVSNGRTLCKKCHKKTHNFGVKIWQK